MRAPQINRIAAPPPEEILAAVKRGQRYAELSVAYGVSESTLRRRVQESDLVVRRRHGVLPTPPVRTEEPDWMERAVCAQTDPETWFPEVGGSNRDAREMCDRCPVIAACLAYSLEHDERHGVWGGKSPNERKALRKAAKS